MSVDLPQLEKRGIYEAKSSVPSLLSDLDQIVAAAKDLEARKKRQGKIFGYMVLAGAVLAIAGVATGFGWLLALALLEMAVGLGGWLSSLMNKGNLLRHPHRLEIARQRLGMIQEDAGAHAPFSVRLTMAPNPVRLSQGTWHGRKNGRQERFEEAWLSLEGPLLDGTVMSDEVKELLRRRTFSNPRGKRKTKSRVTYLVNLRLTYPKELYGDVRPAEQALQGAVKVGPSATLRGVRVTEKAVVLKAMVTEEHEIAKTAGMLSVGGYRILNLARRMAAAEKGRAK